MTELALALLVCLDVTFALICVMTIIAYSHGFNASAFARRYDWQPRDYAWVNGLMTLTIGPMTVATAGIMCDRWRKAGLHDAPFRSGVHEFAWRAARHHWLGYCRLTCGCWRGTGRGGARC